MPAADGIMQLPLDQYDHSPTDIPLLGVRLGVALAIHVEEQFIQHFGLGTGREPPCPAVSSQRKGGSPLSVTVIGAYA